MNLKEMFRVNMLKLYPLGMRTKQELRDAIYVFVVGVQEGLRQSNNEKLLQEWIIQASELAAPGWVPDESWEWGQFSRNN